jgi:glucosamine--fructose-6-phosphate aminotransferase (isomerizing)
MAVLDSQGNIVIKKGVGMLADVSAKLRFSELSGNIGIGHTRWSTHGAVTKENAHPQMSSNGEIAVVHNGIIENYQELRKFLEGKGFKFHSSHYYGK